MNAPESFPQASAPEIRPPHHRQFDDATEVVKRGPLGEERPGPSVFAYPGDHNIDRLTARAAQLRALVFCFSGGGFAGMHDLSGELQRDFVWLMEELADEVVELSSRV